MLTIVSDFERLRVLKYCYLNALELSVLGDLAFLGSTIENLPFSFEISRG